MDAVRRGGVRPSLGSSFVRIRRSGDRGPSEMHNVRAVRERACDAEPCCRCARTSQGNFPPARRGRAGNPSGGVSHPSRAREARQPRSPGAWALGTGSRASRAVGDDDPSAPESNRWGEAARESPEAPRDRPCPHRPPRRPGEPPDAAAPPPAGRRVSLACPPTPVRIHPQWRVAPGRETVARRASAWDKSALVRVGRLSLDPSGLSFGTAINHVEVRWDVSRGLGRLRRARSPPPPSPHCAIARSDRPLLRPFVRLRIAIRLDPSAYRSPFFSPAALTSRPPPRRTMASVVS